MFRRYLYAFILVQGLALVGPASSLAIDWYWIDSLSGPRFYGPSFEWRVFCFKEAVPDIAVRTETNTVTQSETRTESEAERETGQAKDVKTETKTETTTETKTEVKTEAKTDTEQTSKTARMNVIGGLSGSIGPTCQYKMKQRRRGSLQIAFGFYGSSPQPQFAGNESVKLTTLEPSFLWQLHKTIPLEVGLGAGIYWFSSRGLDAFHRATLQPLRVDFRPFDWKDLDRGSWWKSAIVARFGIVVFPQGFAADDFRDTANSIEPREIKKYYGFAFDTEPLIRRFVTGSWAP